MPADARTDRSPEDRPEAGDSGLITVLCLYLVLLAFFILLNFMTTPDETRARGVVDSVQRAFDHRSPATMVRLSGEARTGLPSSASLLVRDLSGLLADLAPDLASETRDGATVVRLAVSSDSLFEPGAATLRQDRVGLLDGVVSALANEAHDALHIETEVLHGVAGLARAGSLEVDRAGALVRALTERGLSETGLAAAIQAGHEGQVLMVFRLLREAPTALDLAPDGDTAP